MPQDARTHANLAHELQQEGRWTDALHHARQVIALAPDGTVLCLWGYAKAATIAVDMGRASLAQQFARIYLTRAEGIPGLDQYTPWVQQAQGIAFYQQDRFREAITWYQRALHGFAKYGEAEQAAVTSSMLACSFVRIGRPTMAREFLADRVEFPASRSYLYDSAMTAILFAEGRLAGVIEMGRKALSAPDRCSFDSADAAEIALLVAKALRVTGARGEASAFVITALRFAVQQRWDCLVRVLLLSRGQRGGDSSRETSGTRGRGSSNPIDGASFSTGCG